MGSTRYFLIMCSVFALSNMALAKKCPSRLPSPQEFPRLSETVYDKVIVNYDTDDLMINSGFYLSSVDSGDRDSNTPTEFTIQPNFVIGDVIPVQIGSDPDGDGYAVSWDRPSRWYDSGVHDEAKQSYGINKHIDDSYRGVGRIWNRGHLYPRAAASRISPLAGCYTHTFANAAPQAAKFNQGSWLSLENYSLSLADQTGRVTVISGTLFNQGEPTFIGDRNEMPIPVPDTFFKVIIDTSLFNEGEAQYWAWVMPNNSSAEGYKKGNCRSDKIYDIERYRVSLDEIERLADIKISESIISGMGKTAISPLVKLADPVGGCHPMGS